jgi:hypothetical protein
MLEQTSLLDYARDHRFQIHPVKSNAIIKTVGKRKIDRVAEKQNELKLGDNTLHFKSIVDRVPNNMSFPHL